MKEKRIGKSSVRPATDWRCLGSQSDSQIRCGIENDPEARPTDVEFWKKARVVMPAKTDDYNPQQSAFMRISSNGCGRKKGTRRVSMQCSEAT